MTDALATMLLCFASVARLHPRRALSALGGCSHGDEARLLAAYGRKAYRVRLSGPPLGESSRQLATAPVSKTGEAQALEGSTPSLSVSGWTVFVCFHPREARWIERCGPVQVCRSCSECRSGLLVDEPWLPAHRLERTEGDRRKMYGADGVTLYQSRPVIFTKR